MPIPKYTGKKKDISFALTSKVAPKYNEKKEKIKCTTWPEREKKNRMAKSIITVKKTTTTRKKNHQHFDDGK